MNTILLHPTDVLFFRDGRPMGGASSGHGAAWPMPSVINHAFHAALHRAGDVFNDVHFHRRGHRGTYEETRDRRFGSLVSAGPFPVCDRKGHREWFFPRPLDADDSGRSVLHPYQTHGSSSLDKPCQYAVVSSRPPSKTAMKSWWNEAAWNAYLGTNGGASQKVFKNDSDFADTEHRYGIGINAESGSVEEGLFYSAHYLRLREDWKLGVFAEAPDKGAAHPKYGNDLVGILLNGNGREILAGGQQRVCTAMIDELKDKRLPLPFGKTSGFATNGETRLVKWVLLSPAIFPKIEEGTSKRGTMRKPHPGGWLPTWICPESGKVLLQTISTEERKRRRGLNAMNQGYESSPNIDAQLVAAIVGKPIPVSGYALPNSADRYREEGGAKPTHLAVPAGSVYYFECANDSEARKLAAALNWHGDGSDILTIKNRRSTLMGEKGFGLGVCGSWEFHESSQE